MSLSKKSLKRRNHVAKAPFVLIMGAALRMNKAAKEYNSTGQQAMSIKHHPDENTRNLVLGYRAELWDVYSVARKVFKQRSSKYGPGITKRVMHELDLKEARDLRAEQIGLSKPGWVRKKVAATTNQYAPRPALLSEYVDSEKVGEMDFEQAVILFKRHLVEALVNNHDIVAGDAVNMVEDCGSNKDLLLKVLNELIEKEALKVYVTRHKLLPSDTPFNVTKITGV